MPSFVPDDSAGIDSHSGVVHLDPAAEYGLSQGKANVHIPRHPHPHSHTSNESFDESSTNSSNSSQTSEASIDTRSHSQVTGKYFSAPTSNPSSMNSNGRPLPNGNSSMILVDRPPKESFPRVSIGADSVQQSPVDVNLLHPTSNKLPIENGASTATIPINAPGAESSQKQQPHRFSSATLYAQNQSSSTSQLHAPPPAPGIKHRHTLEVPKVTQPRGSRDGADTYASGRFSPTITGAGVRRASLSLARRNTRSLHSEMPRDEVIPDEDAMRWTEIYRQRMAKKRQKKEWEDDDRVLVGTKVDENHANWITAYNMLTGIRVSVSRTNAKLNRDLTDADFDVKQKSTFDIAGNELVPSAKYDFKFKDYAPWVFRHLRALFRQDPADYLMSLTGKYILSELGSPGKSGSFFYFSRDYKYIIKTIHHAEHKFLRKILKDYYQHVTENPNTLLSQFYGLHRVKTPYGKKIHFVVMNNLFPPHRDIHQTFDLKGSTIGRDYKEEELENNPRATLKDLNWLRRKRHLELGLQKKKLFLDQLKKDVRLLQRLQIMDYSLLIGIHDLQRGNEENLRDKTLRVFNPGGNGSGGQEENEPNSVLMRTPSKLENQRKARELRHMIQTEKPVPMGETSSRMPDELGVGQNRQGFVFNQDDGGFRATHEDDKPADEIYYLGVIDCLTHYGIIKKIEHFWKGLSSDRSQISALPPHEYGERFINFIDGVTMSQEEAFREAQRRDEEAIAAATAEEERQRTASWGSMRRRGTAGPAPPAPNYNPPPVPPQSSRSPEAEATIERAEAEMRRLTLENEGGEVVTERTLRTTVTAVTAGGGQTVLPVVEEAEMEDRRSRGSREENQRPYTPRKDSGEVVDSRFGKVRVAGGEGRPPPTPPKTGHGYGGGSVGSLEGLRSVSGSQKLGRDSLDKALPPLPR
ncbi:hypothetical protein QBC38DRAFT_366036 [Podospora fimiseda]|uniref:1-phosphatidylinositol-4-phosphate 5-kinase n=1 Tax=Podospora fimiseda TaxID=252190 RepID=A0AAN7BNN2_9PEZI|nr:hypothetical protein QBC38DRAFT_366036 [Podospora fimiseda]